MNIEIKRLWSVPEQNLKFLATTTGTVTIDGKQICFSLENTAVMIPVGVYPVKMLMSYTFQRMTPHLDVPGRTEIEIHGGNKASDSKGCILVAEFRISAYEIYESYQATSLIEESLAAAEANGETNIVSVLSSLV